MTNRSSSQPLVHPLRLAITLGDPAGVGPEIILRLFAQEGDFRALGGRCGVGVVPFVVGEARLLEETARIPEVLRTMRADARETDARGADLTPAIQTVAEPPQEPPVPGTIPIVEPPDFRFEGALDVGRVSARCGAAAWAYVRHAVALVQSGAADAVVTAPLHKEALRAAGCPYPGHTEMLSALAGGAPAAMLLVGGGLRAALVTIHEPLALVPLLLSTEKILWHLRLMDSFIPWFGLPPRPEGGRVRIGGERVRPEGERARPEGERVRPGGEHVRPGGGRVRIGGERVRPDAERVRPEGERARIGGERARPEGERARPEGERVGIGGERVRPGGARVRIGVCGLNPHAGEGGIFGTEDGDIIAPAIAQARAEGIEATGPLPADTAFHFHREGLYDAILAMYHDQALIPVKTLAFHEGVNVTMGLPFIRTSVDHGTAFDIAGRGLARPDSLRAALECAAVLVRNRRAMASPG